MPEISRFYGIVIKMFYNDHEPAHFHAEYGEDQLVVAIETLEVVAGQLRPRANSMVLEWAALRQSELRRDWQLARDFRPLESIVPLP